MQKKDVSSSENKVFQSNNLIEAHYKQEYSVQEQRTILWIISEIHRKNYFAKQANKYGDPRLVVRITAKNYANVMNIPVKNVYRDAQKISKNLMEKVIKIENGNGWKMFHWVSSMEYINQEAVIEATLTSDIVPYIIDLERYTEFKLKNILYMNSSYAIKLYQLLAQYKTSGERTISITNLRYILGISNLKTYKLYGSIKQRILEISKREINKKTDLSISYLEIKKGRKVEAIKFKIEQRKKQEKG